MKKIILFFAAAFTLNFALQAGTLDGCRLVQSEGQQKHYRCSFLGGKKFINFLDFRGSIDDTAYYHGKFLAPEIRDGLILGLQSALDQARASLSSTELAFMDAIVNCVQGHYASSVSPQFLAMNASLVEGINAAGIKTVTENNFLNLNLLVELSIFFDTLKFNMKNDPLLTGFELFKLCQIAGTTESLESNIDAIAKSLSAFKYGCTGIGIPANYTKNNRLIFARNYDSSLLGYFDKYPTIIMAHPTRGHAYVGLASAGMHYAGGITGFNDAGIAISLHELQTSHVKVLYPGRNAAIAPFLVNSILEKAGSIDEAIHIARKMKSFGAWTLFIGDTKTDEFVSIEISGDIVEVSRRFQNLPMPQSNHYIGETTSKYGFQWNFNKTLETLGRIELLKEAAERDEGKIDPQWVIDQLGGHTDYYVGRRAFGRTVTKVYTTMSHVLIPQDSKLYFSLGEVYPASSSTFQGIKFDFDSGEKPFFAIEDSTIANREDRERYPNWHESMGYYVKAFLSYNDLSNNIEDHLRTLEPLEYALSLAERDGIYEVSYQFIRARILLKIAGLEYSSGQNYIYRLEEAKSVFTEILAARLHPYQRSLVYLWLARIEDLKLSAQSSDLYMDALNIHSRLLKQYPDNYGLKTLMNSYYKNEEFLIYDWEKLKGESVEFVTIE